MCAIYVDKCIIFSHYMKLDMDVTKTKDIFLSINGIIHYRIQAYIKLLYLFDCLVLSRYAFCGFDKRLLIGSICIVLTFM